MMNDNDEWWMMNDEWWWWGWGWWWWWWWWFWSWWFWSWWFWSWWYWCIFNHFQMLYVYLILIHPMFSGPFLLHVLLHVHSGRTQEISSRLVGYINIGFILVYILCPPTSQRVSMFLFFICSTSKTYFRGFMFILVGVEVGKFLVKTETGLTLLIVCPPCIEALKLEWSFFPRKKSHLCWETRYSLHKKKVTYHTHNIKT